MWTHRGSLLLFPGFFQMLLDILKPPLFAQLIRHPQCSLKPSQPRDGHVKTHGVHEAHFGTLQKPKTHPVGTTLIHTKQLFQFLLRKDHKSVSVC